jgi:hypothetical protein
VETGKINMKTIKVIEGKAFMCEEIAVNPEAKRPTQNLVYNVFKCIDAVIARKEHCLDEITKAVNEQSIYKIDSVGVYHQDGVFVTSSYEALETLLDKLLHLPNGVVFIDANWCENNLTLQEAAQLYKAWVAQADHYGTHEQRLHDVVITLQKSPVGDPNKTVLRTNRKPE